MTTITTPAGRTLRIDIDTARTLEGVNLSPEEIDEDIDRLIANPADRAEFESECLDGAESRDVIAGWRDYVSEIVVAAERERETTTARCECGEWCGEGCQWSGPSDQMVLVEYMPEEHRISHTAAGNRGSYPDNGAVRIRVSDECAANMIEHDGEWCEIVEAQA
jgi:hypothetical protein